MRPSDFLALSESLLRGSSGIEEAGFRTAADRAYLAFVLLMADILQGRFGIQVPRSTKFYSVIEEQAPELDPHLKDRIAFLRMRRNIADYDLEIAFDKNDAERVIAHAKWMATWLSDKYC